jgi:hypothetical protein
MVNPESREEMTLVGRYPRPSGTTYLLDDVTVSYALSAGLLLAAQNKASKPSWWIDPTSIDRPAAVDERRRLDGLLLA